MLQLIKHSDYLYEIKTCDDLGIDLDKEDMIRLASLLKEAGF
jgi:hypothetical protein